MPDPMVYIGRKRCGCVVGMVVDIPGDDLVNYVADSVAEFIRDGLAVERVTLEVARESFALCDCPTPEAVEA